MIEKKIYFKTIVESVEDVLKEGPIPLIWGGIKEGSFGYVFGPSKSGKTTFCENFAMSLVCGMEEFLGQPILKKRYRVLFISLEEYENQRGERNNLQIQALKDPIELLKDYLVIVDAFPKFFTKDNEWNDLKELITDSEANIIFIDSLTRMSSGDVERSDTGREICKHLKKIAFDCGVTMIVIHHTPKLNGGLMTIDSLAGSHIFAQEADFIIGINRIESLNKNNGIRYVKEVACRYKREDNEKVMKFTINDNMWLESEGLIRESCFYDKSDRRRDDTNLNDVRTLIREYSETTGEMLFKSKDILDEAESNMHKSTYHKHLDTLINTGEISRTSKGKYKFNNPSGT